MKYTKTSKIEEGERKLTSILGKVRRKGDREKERKRRSSREGGRQRDFSHVQTKGFEAFDPDPQTQVHLTKQVRLIFQAVSWPGVRVPRGLNSLLPSLHNDFRTWENNCIRADYLSVFFCSTEVY